MACNPLAAAIGLMESMEPRPAKTAVAPSAPEPLLLVAAESPRGLLPAPAKSEAPAPRAAVIRMPIVLTDRKWAAAGTKMADAEPAAISTKYPAPVSASAVPSTPAMGARQDYNNIAASKMRPVGLKHKLAGTGPQAQISLPGPTLPYELTSLDAAGIAKVQVSVGPWLVPARPQSSWFVSSLVAAGVAAAVLGSVFYAMPTLAGPTRAATTPIVETKAPVPAAPVEPALSNDPLARAVEVTGVRFVTGIPDRRPEIHYLVVNHSAEALAGVTVRVTLRTATDPAPLSQFAFRTARLGAYESKEMVSAIERINGLANMPDWRRVRVDAQIVQ